MYNKAAFTVSLLLYMGHIDEKMRAFFWFSNTYVLIFVFTQGTLP